MYCQGKLGVIAGEAGSGVLVLTPQQKVDDIMSIDYLEKGHEVA